MNTFAIGSLPVHFSVAKLFTFRWQYTVMPDIPFAVLVLLVLGYIIYRIVRKAKVKIEEIRFELDDSPETMRRKAHAKEIMEVDELERAGYLSYEEANKEIDRINKKYFP